MKKILAIILPFCMGTAAIISPTTFAGEEDSEQLSANVTLNVTDSFEWAVPTSIVFKSNIIGAEATVDGNEGSVSVTDSVIEEGKRVSITVTSHTGDEKNPESPYYGDFRMINERTGEPVYYELFSASEKVICIEDEGGEVLSVDAGTTEASSPITATLVTAASGFGVYSDVLTFHAVLKDITES